MVTSLKDSLQFRKMKLADIPQVCEVETESFTTPWTANAYEQEMKHNDLAYYIVIEKDDEIIGFGGMWLIMDEAHVTNIALRAAYRGKGLGEALMRVLQVKAMQEGLTKMTLEVRVSNTVAINLYEKLGFRSAGIRKGYYSDGEDAFVMWANLHPPAPTPKSMMI